MASYVAGLKGLLTENNPADSDMSTMLDCQDVVIARDNSAESRHGINTDKLTRASGTWGTTFNTANSDVSVFKVKFDSTVNSNKHKYVILNGNTDTMTELNTADGLTTSLTVAASSLPNTYTSKPLGFTFDQSLFIVTADGWQEMQKDVQDSGPTGIKKYIRFPGLPDVAIDTFQDTVDPSTNWLGLNKKVGIKFTFVWNTRYNDETPREVESDPSPIYEVLHPMALRTQSTSNISNTLYEKSRIRVRIGSSGDTSPFAEYVKSVSNNRRFFIRVYRTKQVEINEQLPTTYFQAFPDIELGNSRFLNLGAAAVNVGTDYINFGGASVDWQPGSLLQYNGDVTGLVAGSLYYIGSKSGTSYRFYTTNLASGPGYVDITGAGVTGSILVRVYEANLTVNDSGIETLPKLYTNPNELGDGNANSVPPIAKSVVQYKNYQVAANIREPLRAYISLVKQPLVKNVVAKKNIGAGTTDGNYFFNTFTTANGASDFDGLSSGNFGVDSPFFRIYPPRNVSFSGATATVSANSDLPISISGIAGGTPVGSTDMFFDANFVQTNAAIAFRFNGGTVITGIVSPHYNRTSPYTRYTSLPGAFPYVGAISYDQNLEWLQFAGTLTKIGYGTLPFYSTGTTPGRTLLDLANGYAGEVFTPNIYKTNTRGNKKANIIGNGTYNLVGTTLTITTRDYDIAELPSPGIIFYKTQYRSGYFSYKTVDPMSTPTSLILQNVSSNAAAYLGNGELFTYGYVMSGASINNTTFYFKNSPVINTTYIAWSNAVGSSLALEAFPVPLTGYYNKEIGQANSPTSQEDNTLINPLFLGNLAKSPGQLIDDTVIELVGRLNANNIPGVKFIKTSNVGEFYVEYYGGTTIEAQLEGDYHAYEPAIVQSSSTWTTLAKYSKDNVRAVSISRYNLPEAFPNSTILAPFLVGRDDKEIVALARNANYCFILKEDGIWRLTIAGNAPIASVDQIVNIDTTTYCQAQHSVQEINEEIIFLSQKGFVSINGNNINAIGRTIETEVKTKLQRSIANGLQNEIRSWVNEEKRIYGCTIRDTTSTYTTYILNTFTREWTKFALPVIDAPTRDGKTTYLISMPQLTLGAGINVQAQLATATVGTTSNFYLTEEAHTGGINRNEADQWDYRYTPGTVSAALNGDGVVTGAIITDLVASNTTTWSSIQGGTTNITTSGLSFFVGRSAYYKKAGIVYPCTFGGRSAGFFTIGFPGPVYPPETIGTISGDDGLYAGVPASITLNPTNLGAPDTSKVFTEYQLHTIEAISSLTMQFITDSRADYTPPRVFAFNAVAVNRTVYRTYIPIEATRGRWLIRKFSHDVPFERLQAASQSITVRDTASTRVQKNNR